ncbi:MAG: NADH-quinone oxidoreductase subunit N [Verrucomicrobia subdivision 3 bacterium]|nr:NADH-quinone oxidoreductase subunit N [Limisphaerales bacterium]MCS1414446.1 NADH-quinone oxidoreductase subunit N [Limisphaerales bacterium]
MTEINYSDILLLLIPETILVISALGVLTADLLWIRESPTVHRQTIAFGMTVFGCLAAVISIIMGSPITEEHWLNLGGVTGTVKIGLIGLTLSALALSTRSALTQHIGELYLIVLLALVGMLLMASANHLLLAFLALELVSLSFYTLVAFHKRSRSAIEGALKYFLLGGVAAAFTAFGMSFIYGATHSLSFSQIAIQVSAPPLSPLMFIGMIAIAIGFGFKIAAVPIHLWAPDVYQAAAPPIGALIASASKLASFYLFARLWMIGLGPLVGPTGVDTMTGGWLVILASLALSSLVIGNLVAITQSSMKRLLAYSAIAHAGYVLLGIMANNSHGMASMIYYLITYGLAITGAFALVQLVEKQYGDDQITSFANLHRQLPVEAFCLLIFLLSLAGIPPLAGFFGKFYLFAAALQSAQAPGLMFWLVVISIAMSAVSLYYYLRVLKQVYVFDEEASKEGFRSDPTLRAVAIIMAAGVILLGCFPDLVVRDLLGGLGVTVP